MRGRWITFCGVLLVVLLATSLMGSAAGSTRFRVGEEIQFKVEDSTTWFWGCCTCAETVVLGWRVVNSSEQVVYSVGHDAPVSSAAWLGSWAQVDSLGATVAMGQYKLYVDTSLGTLSKCFTIYDPCGCGWCNPCVSCICEGVSSISDCACRATLVFVDTCRTGCFPFPFFWGWGCSRCSPCCP